jgi:DhnA family fructose-bisphosphate aldolase class Ia
MEEAVRLDAAAVAVQVFIGGEGGGRASTT